MLKLLETYDTLLVDAYGVLWDGAGLIAGVKETLHTLVAKGKTVIILSNTTQRSQPAAEKYAAHGLIQGQHYHHLITSGEVARSTLEQGLVLNGKSVRRDHTFGTPNTALFAGLAYEATSLDKAEFVYIGIPQLTQGEKEALSTSHTLCESCLSNETRWDAANLSPFAEMLDKVAAAGLPVMNANPDRVAPEKCKATQHVHSVVRQGSIAEALEQRGLSVRSFGKPYSEIYAFCRTLLPQQPMKIAMVGDTMETDILGAHNATKELGWPIDGILTLTGNGINATNHQHAYKPHAVITSFGISGSIIEKDASHAMKR